MMVKNQKNLPVGPCARTVEVAQQQRKHRALGNGGDEGGHRGGSAFIDIRRPQVKRNHRQLEANAGVRRAASYIVRNGPVTQQDRWEEDPGYSPFTLAAEIAALLVAADLAELQGEPATAAYLRETADAWNDNIERWVNVTGSDLARRHGVAIYELIDGQSTELS